MLNTIKTRLFVTLLLANALLALLTYLVISWSFDRGFLNYLQSAEQERLQPLITALTNSYREEGSWEWIADQRHQWMQLLHSYHRGRTKRDVDKKDIHPTPKEGRPGEASLSAPSSKNPPHPPHSPSGFDPRVMLLDSDKSILNGPPEATLDGAILTPIVIGDETVGYVGLLPRRELVESVEQVFSAQQNRNFAIIAAGMLLTSVVLASVIAAWLARPLRALTQGTRKLTRGQFDHQIEVRGRDELAQLAQDFNRLANTLAANQQAHRQWIADIAHELRTPLTILNGEIEAMLDGIITLSKQSIVSLGNEVKQLTRLVADLYELSRSDLGALEYKFQSVELGQHLQDVIDTYNGSLQKNGLTISLNRTEEPRIQADPQRLTQVWNNLLQNSMHYTDAPGHIQIDINCSRDSVVIDWQDSSPGVTDEDLPRLTERLFRVESSRNRATGGSGLGLAIANTVVQAHGGEMQPSRSSLGGLAWHITLPISAR